MGIRAGSPLGCAFFSPVVVVAAWPRPLPFAVLLFVRTVFRASWHWSSSTEAFFALLRAPFSFSFFCFARASFSAGALF